MAGVRSSLRRYHIWLGWLIGVPMLLWTVSGVLMVVKPIEEVRGAALLADPLPLSFGAPLVAPAIDFKPTTKVTLEQRAAGPRWVLHFADGASRMADPASGRLLPRLSAADATGEVVNRYRGNAKVLGAVRIDPTHPPIELRREMDGWMVAMSDDTHFYVDAGSGEVVARRTAWWRVYDFMWGLHIMDLETREDAHNPWLIGFGILAAVTTIMALLLLPMASRRRKKSAT
jgi:hypothetical protein